jgi:hypothetical protein
LLFVDNYISDDVSALSRGFDVTVIVLHWVFVSNCTMMVHSSNCIFNSNNIHSILTKNTSKAMLHTTLRQLLSLSIKADWFIGV